MNYYVFYIYGSKSKDYLNGTNYAGIWATDVMQAARLIESYIGDVYFKECDYEEYKGETVQTLY